MARSEHHICFDKAQWSKGHAGVIRNHPYMRVPLVWTSHARIHEEVSIVPVPDRHTLQKVVTMFNPIDDPITNINLLIDAIDTASSYDRHPNDRILAELTMSALQRQIPYIRKGAVGYARAS